MTNKLIKQNLEELKKQTLLNILSAKGVIWTYYKIKLGHRDTHSSLETFLGIKGRAEKQQKGNKMKEYIVDIKGVCILEDEWENTHITITRNGISDTLEFDKSDIVETKESEE